MKRVYTFLPASPPVWFTHLRRYDFPFLNIWKIWFLFSLNDCFFMRENVFHILLDEPTILQKSTRHVIYDHKLPESEIDKKGKKHYENYLTTSSTIVIRGLLDFFLLAFGLYYQPQCL